MNCKQGDLALVIRGGAANVGKLVRCLEALPEGFERDDLPAGMHQQINASEGLLWRTDRVLNWGNEHLYPYCRIAPDYALMPIRPAPERDDSEVLVVESENSRAG